MECKFGHQSKLVLIHFLICLLTEKVNLCKTLDRTEDLGRYDSPVKMLVVGAWWEKHIFVGQKSAFFIEALMNNLAVTKPYNVWGLS